jgi:hypothetical protein
MIKENKDENNNNIFLLYKGIIIRIKFIWEIYIKFFLFFYYYILV